MFSAIGYLWFNVIGCVLVAILALVLQALLPRSAQAQPSPG
jgi:hypothetical protein